MEGWLRKKMFDEMEDSFFFFGQESFFFCKSQSSTNEVKKKKKREELQRTIFLWGTVAVGSMWIVVVENLAPDRVGNGNP